MTLASIQTLSGHRVGDVPVTGRSHGLERWAIDEFEAAPARRAELRALVAASYAMPEAVLATAQQNASHVYMATRNGRLSAVLFGDLDDPLACGASAYVGLLMREPGRAGPRAVDVVIRAMQADIRRAEQEAGVRAWVFMRTASARVARLFRHYYTDVSPRPNGSGTDEARGALGRLAGADEGFVLPGFSSSRYRPEMLASGTAVALDVGDPWLRPLGFSEARSDRVAFVGRLPATCPDETSSERGAPASIGLPAPGGATSHLSL